MAVQNSHDIDEQLKKLLGGLSKEQIQKLNTCAAAYNEISRKETPTVFLLGKHFSEVRELLPGKWEKWVRLRCEGVTKRTLTNYISVWSEFRSIRDRIERSGLRPAHLYALAGARAEIVEQILLSAESGHRVTTSDIRKLNPKPADKVRHSVPSENNASAPKTPGDALTKLTATLTPRLSEIIAVAVNSAGIILRILEDDVFMTKDADNLLNNLKILNKSVDRLAALAKFTDEVTICDMLIENWQEAARLLYNLLGDPNDQCVRKASVEFLRTLLAATTTASVQPEPTTRGHRGQAAAA